MPDIAYSNVTFTVIGGMERKAGGVRGLREVTATIAFGNNTLTYPTNGVPITGASHLGVTELVRACRALGFPEELVDLIILDQSNNAKGYKFEWDKTNNKIKVFVSAGFTPAGAVTGTAAAQAFTGSALAAHNHDMKVIGGQAAHGTSTVTVPAATDLLGKEEAADADILGADYATKGGVVPITAGTPAGTNAASALTATFAGTAVGAAGLAEHANATFVPNPATLRVLARGY